MATLFEPPTREIIALFFALLAVGATARGVRLLTRGVVRAVPIDLIRGIRACVVAFASVACALGILRAETGFLVLGALVLGEELYETGLVCLIIRLGEDRPAEPAHAARWCRDRAGG
jgi:hypothetical protein